MTRIPTRAETRLPVSESELKRLADAELSLPARLGHVSLLLAALMMTAVSGALWLSEVGLPTRTRIAFAVMVVIGASWVAYSVWVLTHRRVLLAGHRIVAGRIAVVSTALFTTGALAVGLATGRSSAYTAAAAGAAMLGAAVGILVRAHRAFSRLRARRAELERDASRSAK